MSWSWGFSAPGENVLGTGQNGQNPRFSGHFQRTKVKGVYERKEFEAEIVKAVSGVLVNARTNTSL